MEDAEASLNAVGRAMAEDIARGRSLTLGEAKAIVGPMVARVPAELGVARRMLQMMADLMRIPHRVIGVPGVPAKAAQKRKYSR